MLTGKTYRYAAHLAICMALVCLYFFPVLRANWQTPAALEWVLIRCILYGFINFHLFYILVFAVLPLHHAKQHMRAILYAVIIVLLFCLLKYGVGLLFPEQVLRPGIPLTGTNPPYTSFITYFRHTLQTGIAVMLAAYAYRIFLNWRSSDRESRSMEKAVQGTARQYERMQRSSQLLLRHLRAPEQALKDASIIERTGVPGILELSELLRYMLYDRSAQEEKAALARELQYYRTYLDLHNRLFPQQPVQLHITGNIGKQSIEPLFLQTATEKILTEQPVQAPVTLWLHIGKRSLALSRHRISTPRERLFAYMRSGWGAWQGFKTPLYVEGV